MNAAQINRLLEFDTPTVANGVELLGVRDPSIGYSGPDVRALMPELGRRAGIAVTARMDTTTAGTDQPDGGLWLEWVRQMARVADRASAEALPVFAVIESVGPRPRYTVTIGDGMATTMKLAGAVAYLTNGSIRDLEGVRQVPLACWATGLSPMHGRIRWLDVGSPVVIDGMTVRPGDLIHADVNGVLVLPAELADDVYERAAAVHADEAAFFAQMRRPGLTIDEYLASQG